MDQTLFVPYLKNLTEKYSLATGLTAEFSKSAIDIKCDKGEFHFYYDFSEVPAEKTGISNVPLFYWRNKRKYKELKNIVTEGLIGKPLSMRVQHIVAPDEYVQNIVNVFCYEADLTEYLVDQKINKIFADSYKDKYMNCIISTEGEIKASMELGLSLKESEPVILHEIVAKEGIASDDDVYSQIQQYPIYVFKGKETLTYNDIDNELYGLENTQADCIRFIMDVLQDPSKIEQLNIEAVHLKNLYVAAKESNSKKEYTGVA